ncbi:PLP-dependent aminotransferase family protein [Amycolatopsis rhizosphaerae]|uniref:PLP-dependent aminotransferase family protein n=1 Tax=Amycolatopsis rhizosphaerae TaxID=2053003 RepID=A0A558DIN0_9PSEU|nr:PLP-dependent aminotransferase family protein [Amycolatopsis rhizosphaerae]TVT60871.1 PLP-dependent aminotransferase family protein [Amycolatopsis rhizosphaerae]
MDVHVSLAGSGDLASRIYRQLADAILDGRLRPGERLPPTRELALRLAVARNTVSVAYERLAAEGFVVARVGAGTFVGTEPVAPRAARARSRSRAAPTGRGVQPRPIWNAVTTATPGVPPPVHDFRVGTPDPGLFPFATWRRLVAGELRASAVRTISGYAETSGHAGLREAIARYVGVSRSVRACADDVLVTQGAQQALDLVGRVLIEPGDSVAVEEPGYPAARLLFRSLGARVAGVPVDDEGLVVSALPDSVRLVYVTPSHQFPLGMPMSPARRASLLEWASRRGAVIVEDDYDSEFRFGDRPLEPLQSLDRTGRVIYVGTFSKTLLPILRLGFLIAPASLQAALCAAKRFTDWHSEYVGQAALARFIDSGELSRHVRRATRVYAERRERIVTTLQTEFADWLDTVPSAAGLHLSARLKPDTAIDIDAVLQRAGTSGIAVERLAAYYADSRPQPGLVLGYGTIATDDIAEGLTLLARHFRSP